MNRLTILGSMLLLLGACKHSEELDASNSVEKTYPLGTEEVWRAVENTMGRMELTVESDRHDALGGTLVARRVNNDKIVIQARAVDEHNTSVGVGVGGIDRNMAGMIQGAIGRQLATETSGREFFGGSTVEAVYDVALSKALLAADRAFECLNLVVTNREVEETRALLLCQKSKTTPVLLRIEVVNKTSQNGGARKETSASADGQAPRQPQSPHATEQKPVRVTFVAGTARTQENDQFVVRIKTEFERFLR
jgi:hypothetical protein